MRPRGIHHIGHAVDDIDGRRRTCTSGCSARVVEHRETVPEQGVEAVSLRVGERPRRAAAAARRGHPGGPVHGQPRPGDAPRCLRGGRHPGGAARRRRRRRRADRRGAPRRPLRAPGRVHPSLQRRRRAGRIRATSKERSMADDMSRVELGFDSGLIVITKLEPRRVGEARGGARRRQGRRQISAARRHHLPRRRLEGRLREARGARGPRRLLRRMRLGARPRGGRVHDHRQQRDRVGRRRRALGSTGPGRRDRVGDARRELRRQAGRRPRAPRAPPMR